MSYNKLIKELSTQDENTKCMDCKSANPHWASISCGIFICLECAATHRSYGVKISKVRSVNMDNWTEAMYKIMSNGGNKRFRELMETYNLTHLEKEDLYKNDCVRKYSSDLTGELEEKKNYNTNNTVYKSYKYEERKCEKGNDDLGSKFNNVKGYLSEKAIFFKDKSLEIGGKLNKNFLSPAATLLKEKTCAIKDKWYNKKESKASDNYYNVNEDNDDVKEKKEDYNKWD